MFFLSEWIRLSLVLLSRFPGVVRVSPYQKAWLEKTVISNGNMNPKEVFNTLHKFKPLSLNNLERIRNWKKSLSTLTQSVMLTNSCGAWPDAAHSESALNMWAQFLSRKGHFPTSGPPGWSWALTSSFPWHFRGGRSSRSTFWHWLSVFTYFKTSLP